MTADTVVRVQRTEGPALCAVEGCTTPMSTGTICHAHARQLSIHRAARGRNRPPAPVRQPPVAGKQALYWVDLDALTAAIAQRPARYPRGLCADTARVNWFGENQVEQRPAQLVCAACPHLMPCLARAVTRGEEWGVWGGTNAAERRALRRALRARGVRGLAA